MTTTRYNARHNNNLAGQPESATATSDHQPAQQNSVNNSPAEQESPFSDNLQALVRSRNDTINNYTRDAPEIPAALVQLKWKNRHEIYPMIVREEIYGMILQEIIQRQPELRDKIIKMLEQQYQEIKREEATSLTMTRKLVEGNYQMPAPLYR